MNDTDALLMLVILFEVYVTWHILSFTLINWLSDRVSCATTQEDLARLLLWVRTAKKLSGADQLHRKRVSDLEDQLTDQLAKFSNASKST